MNQKEINETKKIHDIETVNNGDTWFATKQIYGPMNTVSISLSGPSEDFAVSKIAQILESSDLESGLLPAPEFEQNIPEDDGKAG